MNSGRMNKPMPFILKRKGNPLNIVKSTDCKVWLDGEDTSQFSLNGNKVIQWDCKGALAAHVFNAIDAQRPTYDANTGRVTFTQINSTFLQSAVFGVVLSQPNTVFVVYKVTIFNKYIIDGANSYHAFRVYGNFDMYAGNVLNGSARNTNNNIHTGLFNGASSKYWINGILEGSGDVGAISLDGITLGAINSLSIFADVEIMEVIVYNADITNAERIGVTLYLKNKHRLTY